MEPMRLTYVRPTKEHRHSTDTAHHHTTNGRDPMSAITRTIETISDTLRQRMPLRVQGFDNLYGLDSVALFDAGFVLAAAQNAYFDARRGESRSMSDSWEEHVLRQAHKDLLFTCIGEAWHEAGLPLPPPDLSEQECELLSAVEQVLPRMRRDDRQGRRERSHGLIDLIGTEIECGRIEEWDYLGVWKTRHDHPPAQ